MIQAKARFLQATVLFLFLNTAYASAQSRLEKFEFAVHFPALHLTNFNTTSIGVGGRTTYNLFDWLAIEGEGSFFPTEHTVQRPLFFGSPEIRQHPIGGQKLQGLAGVKAGKRFEHFGVFAKARPGLLHFSDFHFPQAEVCVAVFPPPLACLEMQSESVLSPVFDWGGIFEIYPSMATFLRFDVSNTMVSYSRRLEPWMTDQLPPLLNQREWNKKVWTDNFQLTAGIGIRF